MAFKVVSFGMTGGLNADQLPALVPDPSWTAVQNVNFRNGVANRVQGYTGVGGVCTTVKPRHLVAWNQGESFLLGVAATNVFAAGEGLVGVNLKIEGIIPSTSTHAAHTPAAWAGVAPAQVGQWTGGIFNGIAYFNHPGYPPVDFRAGTPFATLPDWVATFGAGQTCYALRHHREFYVALGLGAAGIMDGDRVNWSARAAVTTTPAVWTPAAGNAAGNAELSGGGELVDALQMGSVLMLYKRRSVWAMRYVGGNYVFDFQRVLDGRGLLSQNCCVQVGQDHVFLTDDDILRWNGSASPVSILDNKARKLLAASSGQAGWEGSFLLYLPRNNEIWVCASRTSTNCDVYVVDLATGHMGTRALGLITHGTWVRDTSSSIKTTGQMVLSYYNGASSAIAPIDSATSLMGTAYTTYAERRSLTFGQPQLTKTVAWVRPWVRPTGAVINCYVGGSMTADDAATYGSAQVFTSGTTDKVNFLVKGRFLHFKFEATSGDTWTIEGFDVGYELGGAE